MKAVTWQGRRKVSVDNVPDAKIEKPTDAVIRVTTTNICGSDLHLYEVLGAFMTPGDILGHELTIDADEPVASFDIFNLPASPVATTDPALLDSDADGIPDADETAIYGTDPGNADIVAALHCRSDGAKPTPARAQISRSSEASVSRRLASPVRASRYASEAMRSRVSASAGSPQISWSNRIIIKIWI